MRFKILPSILSILFSFSVIFFSGCDRTIDVSRTIDCVDREDLLIGETIKVGILQPGDHFESFAKGARLASAEINASGGIFGAEVELIERDTEFMLHGLSTLDLSTNMHPLQVAKDLIEEAGVVAILDPIYPIGYGDDIVELAPVLRLSPRMQTIHHPYYGTVPHPYYGADYLVFSVADSNTLQGELLADFAVKVFRAERAAVVYQAKNTYSLSLVNAFRSEFSHQAGAIVADDTYDLADTNFSELLSRIHRANPDVIIVSGFGKETALFIQAARDFGIETRILGDNTVGTAKSFEILEDKENVYYMTNFIDDLVFSTFSAAYTSMFGGHPDGTAAAGYDAVYLLKVAIETARSTDSADMSEALFLNLTNFQAATQTYHYNMFGYPVKSAGIEDVSGKYSSTYAWIEPASVDFRDPRAGWHVAIIDEDLDKLPEPDVHLP